MAWAARKNKTRSSSLDYDLDLFIKKEISTQHKITAWRGNERDLTVRASVLPKHNWCGVRSKNRVLFRSPASDYFHPTSDPIFFFNINKDLHF